MGVITYVVSGHRRTGTSMMMHCLQLGGLELYYDVENEKRLLNSLNANPYYYEMSNLKDDEWPVDAIKGKCVKAMGSCALQKGLDPMKAVYMSRNPLSQYKSSKNSLGNIDSQYTYWRQQTIFRLSKSKEIEDLVIFEYDDVLYDPLKAFEKLVEHGWPIDPEKASSGVDRSMNHYPLQTERQRGHHG